VVLAVAATWPLTLELRSRLPDNLQDPSLTAWQLAWAGHALIHQPLHLFQANAFWPLSHSLAFTDPLVGYAPAGLIGSGPGAAVARFNLLYLFSSALAFAGTYALARELGVGRAAAAVAGIAFAYAPWRLTQSGHLHILSSGGVPLALFLLLRGYRRRSPRTVLGGWVVATWQILVSVSIGLQLAYVLIVLGVLAAAVWLRRGRPALDRGMLAATSAGVALMLICSVLLATALIRVASAHPEARRSIAEVTFYSPPVKGLLAAPRDDRLWGGLGERILVREPYIPEQALFPGAVVLLLAIAGLAAPTYRRGLRIGLLLAVLVTATLALGFSLAGEWSPYRLLYELAPGWQGIRTPARLVTLTLLGLALLAAGGAQWMLGAARRRSRVLSASLAFICLAAVFAEGLGDVPHPRVPTVPPGTAVAPPPQLHLPSTVVTDPAYMLGSTAGFPAIANGYSGFNPVELALVRRRTASFPDRDSIAFLRRHGICSVVIHPTLPLGRLAANTPQQSLYGVQRASALMAHWRRAAARLPSVAGVTRTTRAGLVIYRLGRCRVGDIEVGQHPK
jgi:hypothetical protein